MPLTPYQEAIADHVAREIGPIHGIFELAPAQEASLPMAVLHVPATEFKPFQLLVTAGMSAEPMPVPEDLEGPRPDPFIELVIGLPADWPTENPGEAHAWPIRLLADLATFPSEFGSWLGEGHTIPHGDPMVPYAPGTQMCCALVAPALTIPQEGQLIPLGPGRAARLFGVVPLFEREVELKLNEGVARLFERLDEHRVTEVLSPDRRSVAGTLLDLLDRRQGKRR